MIFPSYSQAKKLYEQSVVLSQTWLSKYYPELNKEFSGVQIEEVQAFSQHFFFSCLITKDNIDSSWSQYPLPTQRKQSGLSLLGLPKRILKIAISFIESVEKLEILGKHHIILLANGRHLEDQFELLNFLSRRYAILVVGKISSQAQSRLKQKKINFINVTTGQKYLSRVERIENLWSFIRTSTRKPQGNMLFENQLWIERLRYLRFEQFPDIAALLTLARRIFQESEPRVVLTTSSNDVFGASFCRVAQHMGLPIAEIQHGYINRGVEPRFYKADYELVWGNLPKRFLEGSNFKVVSVGNTMIKKPNKVSGTIKSKKTRLLILLAPISGIVSIFRTEENHKVISSLIKGLEKLPNGFEITIRCHPSYDIEADIQGIKLKNNISLDKSRDIVSAIEDSDVVLTQPTTAGFIAVLYNKPLLFFDSSWLTEKNGDPIRDSKSAREIPLNELEKADKYILDFIRDKKALGKQKAAQTKFINDYCSGFEEKSFKMISDFVENTIS